jgi:hypothetical protein
MRGTFSHRRACGLLCAAVTSLTLLATLPSRSSGQAGEKKRVAADVKRYVQQLATRFTAWDTNGDNSLDKQELAIAFRGADAKPFDYQPMTPREKARMLFASLIGLPPYILLSNQTLASVVELQASRDTSPAPSIDPNLLPDYQFLILAGTKGSTTLSRQEYNSWAKSYAQLVANQSSAQRVYQTAVNKLNKLGKSKNKKAILAAQNAAQRALTDFQSYTMQLNAIPVAIRQTVGLKQ